MWGIRNGLCDFNSKTVNVYRWVGVLDAWDDNGDVIVCYSGVVDGDFEFWEQSVDETSYDMDSILVVTGSWF